MAKLRMQKIEMIALLEDSQKIVERLQRRGVMELIRSDDEDIVSLNTNSSVAQFERNILTANSALEYLQKYCGTKGSLFDSLNGRKALTTDKFAENKQYTERTLSVCHSVLDCVKKIGESENNILKYQTQIDILRPWKSLDLPQNYKGTKYTSTFIGTLPDMVDEVFVSNEILKCDEKAYVETEVVSSSKEQTCVAVTCHKTVADSVLSALREMGFVQISQGGKQTPSDEIDSLEKKILQSQNSIEELKKKI